MHSERHPALAESAAWAMRIGRAFAAIVASRKRVAAALRSALVLCIPFLVMQLGLIGCQRQMLPASAVDQFPGADDELDFLSEVHAMTAVTNNDALHGLFLFADGVDPATTYEERVATAKARRWMPSSFRSPANESAPVGWLAMAGCQICGIKGGLTMHVLGPSPRYCTRELVFLQVIPLRTENQSLAGAEFTDYLNRLQRVRGGVQPEIALDAGDRGPAGEQSSLDMNEADVEEMLPAPGDGGGATGLSGSPADPSSEK